LPLWFEVVKNRIDVKVWSNNRVEFIFLTLPAAKYHDTKITLKINLNGAKERAPVPPTFFFSITFLIERQIWLYIISTDANQEFELLAFSLMRRFLGVDVNQTQNLNFNAIKLNSIYYKYLSYTWYFLHWKWTYTQYENAQNTYIILIHFIISIFIN